MSEQWKVEDRRYYPDYGQLEIVEDGITIAYVNDYEGANKIAELISSAPIYKKALDDIRSAFAVNDFDEEVLGRIRVILDSLPESSVEI